MSILGSIMASVLGRPAPPAPPTSAAASGGKERQASAPPVASEAPGRTAASAAPPARTPQEPSHARPPTATHSAAEAAAPQVDVAAVLDKLAKEAGQKLNWRSSIVDLMKLLKLDSGLAARKTLAKELNYVGDTKDSATLNVWLHKQVMAKLAQGGGKLPDDLKPDPKPDPKQDRLH
jgi:Domain of unknown function (DUF3597)